MWLNFLTMWRRGRLGVAAALLACAVCGHAAASPVNFKGGNVTGCTLSSSTYTCATLPLINYDDIAVIGSGYTVVVTAASVAPGYNQGLTMSGSAVLQTSNGYSVDLSASNNINISGGSFNVAGNFKLGASAQSITANVSAATITTAGSSTSITGTVSASGAINFGSNTTINGSVTAASITTGSATTINGSLSVSGSANLGSSIKITGNLSANAVQTGSPASIGGSITSTTTIALGSSTTVGGSISGTTITTDSPVTLNGNVTATTAFTLASGSSVTGNITAPTVTLSASSSTVKGNISASTALDMGSGVIVTGTVSAGGLTMRASGATINGTTTISGDVDMGSGSTINGDLTARNVTTHSSNAIINGNAAVNAIYIDWGANVTKTITCTGPGAVQCSCVTKADPNWQPTCGAAPASAPHHILITHSGSALTCQAQPVTLRACADAACSTTFTGATTVTLTPGGGSVTFSGTANASVSQTSAGTATLATNQTTTCLNSATGTASCAMVFSDSGLQLSAPDHVSMSSANLTIQALKSGPNNSSCVPLVQNASVPVKFSCGYSNPSSGTMKVNIGGTDVACGSGTTSINLAFNSAGTATPALSYPDVGLMSVGASYTSGSVGASGSTFFTTAPQSFQIVATPSSGASLNANYDPFGRASDTFTLAVSAVNAKNAVTPNFGQESSAESFNLTENLKLPSDGLNAIVKGTFAAIKSGVGNSSSGTAGLWSFNESGTITLNAALSNSSGYYMGKSVTGFNTKGTLDLRFIPHHFDTLLVAGNTTTYPQSIPMSCAGLGGYSNPCTGNTAGYFVYAGQGFYMLVNAYRDGSTQPQLSQNYRPKTANSADSGDVSKAITLALAASAGGSAASGVSLSTAPSFIFTAGAGQLVATSNQPDNSVLPMVTFSTATVDPVTVYLRATDADGATSNRTGAGEAALTIVNGRMMLSNAYGSANSALPLKARAQYYSSAAKTYLFNPVFSPVVRAVGAAMPVANTYGKFSQCTGALTCSALRLVPSTMQFKNGEATFMVAAPSASGTALVGFQSGLLNQIPYLPQPSGNIDPGGHITFGVYRSGPLIYTREIYN